jgi:hypothetical protein
MTKQETQVKPDEKTLSRTEATWAADWLEKNKGKFVRGGWMGVFRLTVREVADMFEVNEKELLKVIRR